MFGENKRQNAEKVYRKLCAALDAIDFSYEKNDEKLLVEFKSKGNDLPMQFYLQIDDERQIITLISPLEFEMQESMRIEGALAVCAANYGMADGSFDYSLSSGRIAFRITTSFLGCEVGQELLLHMIMRANAVVDRYNDRFLAISQSYLDVNKFIAEEL